MKLLGLYNSKLQAFHYAELLQQYKLAISQGDHAGSKIFDEASINNLIQASQDFSSLPVASAGQVVTDDSINHPLALLAARFSALVAEAQDFDNRAAGLIAVMEKDTALLDQLLAAADLQKWIEEQPKMNGTDFSWSFGMGHGPSDGIMAQIDPTNGVEYSSDCPTGAYLDAVTGIINTGLKAPSIDTVTISKNMLWTFPNVGETEDLYGDGWAELTILSDDPVINFQTDPTVQTLLPINGTVNGIFEVQGPTQGATLPIYVRTLFSPRRNSITQVPQNALPDGSAEAGGTGWSLGSGWTINSSGTARTGTSAFKALFSVSQGVLVSPSMPVSQTQYVYVEFYVRAVNANGTMHVYLSCQDTNGAEISRIYIPTITPPEDYLQITENIQISNDPNIVSFQIVVTLDSFTFGAWYIDDARVHLPQNLSQYTVDPDTTSAYTVKPDGEPFQMYFNQEDFIVDDSSNVTFLNLPDGQEFTVRFTERFPGYQCSINEKVWSPLVMLDPLRPYPDSETQFDPIEITAGPDQQRNLFPITDELGIPVGLSLKMIGQPLYEYYFVVTIQANPHYGVTGVLEVDMSKSAFLTGLTLSPFSNFSPKLLQVEAEAFAENTKQTIGLPNTLLDRPVTLTFPSTLVRKLFLTCYQENYTLEEHVIQPPDQLRRDTLVALQASLPFNVRRASRAVPIRVRGAQYGLGLENIAGVASTDVLPGIYVAGKYRYLGIPEVIRYDADLSDDSSIETYLCWIAYDSSGNEIDTELMGQLITNGNSIVFPFSNSLTRTTVAYVDIYLKFVFRTGQAVVEKFLLQVTNAQ